MNRLFNKLKNIFALIIIIVIFISYFGVFMPLKNELQDSLHDGFKNMVSSAEINIEDNLNRALENAAALSSRTMIKREIEKYLAGEITFSELEEYTQSKYDDGVSILKHLQAAYRFVEGRILAHSGEDYLELISSLNFLEELNNDLKISEDQKYIVIRSIIKNDQEAALGADYIIYDLEAILRGLNQLNAEEIDYSIQKNINPAESGIKNGEIVEIRRLLDTDYYLKAETSSTLIYNQISSLSSRIMLVILFTILIISLLVLRVLKNESARVIKNLKKEVKEQTRLAETDEMLGIHNRSKFNDELEKEMDRARRYDNSLSLIMLDIDHFKKFNDNHGHHIGDQILKRIVKIVSDKIRNYDILARYGGDEFMLICPETELEAAEKLAQRLNEAINNYNCEHDNDLSCSFGVAEFNLERDDKESLIQRADQALYKAKEQGRNRVCKNN